MAKAEPEENVRDALLSRCDSDAAAFAVLYDIYYEKIFSYCSARVQIRQIAQDLTSETFITAAENAAKFNGKTRTDFADWLYAIATGRINAYLKKREIRLSAGEARQSQPETITWPTLHSAILKLSLKEQTVITLRFFENLAIDRIENITGLTSSNIRLEIAKAIEKLKLCDTEKQLADIVKGLNVDNSADESHKERLRTKIVVSFNSARLKKYQFASYFLAAVVILMTAGAILWIFSGSEKPVPLSKTAGLQHRTTEVNFVPQKIEKSRLEKIKQLAEEKNIAALLEILKKEDLPSKLLAAKFLAELTDTNAADIMKLVVPAKRTEIETSSPQKTLLIRVIDKKTKGPVANALLLLKFDEENENKFLTDSNGQFLLELPAEPLNILQIRAQAKGYAPMIFRLAEPTALKGVLFEMLPVATIGGLVVNEALAGIENADVKIHIDSGLNQGLPVFETDQVIKTDANGIWRCRDFPQDVRQISLMITHPDYISQDEFQPALTEQLANLSYLTILEKGIAVSGRVFDWNKKPLAAIVGRGVNYESRNQTVCDANGEFGFANIRAGKEIFTVQFPGAAPQLHQLDVDVNMPPMVFELQPAKTIRARFIDDKGQPVDDVSVKVSGWRGFETLKFETTSDENGSFQWTDAPDDEVLFDFYKPGFKPVGNFGMTSDNDYVILLERQ